MVSRKVRFFIVDNILKCFFNDKRIKVLFREQNNGKGANIKNALNEATGDLILFQDGDLEYSPNDFKDLLEPFFI